MTIHLAGIPLNLVCLHHSDAFPRNTRKGGPAPEGLPFVMGYGRARNHSRDLGRCSSVGTSAGCGTGSSSRARRAIVAVPGGDNPNVSRCLVIHRRIDPSGSSTRRPSGRIVVGMKSEGHPVVHLTSGTARPLSRSGRFHRVNVNLELLAVMATCAAFWTLVALTVYWLM